MVKICFTFVIIKLCKCHLNSVYIKSLSWHFLTNIQKLLIEFSI